MLCSTEAQLFNIEEISFSAFFFLFLSIHTACVWRHKTAFSASLLMADGRIPPSPHPPVAVNNVFSVAAGRTKALLFSSRVSTYRTEKNSRVPGAVHKAWIYSTLL